jgi:hypothetical protein
VKLTEKSRKGFPYSYLVLQTGNGFYGKLPINTGLKIIISVSGSPLIIQIISSTFALKIR